MTKRLRILALGLMIVVLLATLSGCSVDGVKDKIMGIIGPYLPGCQHEGGEATCTTQAVCEKCGVAYGNVLGHDIVVDAAVAPDCENAGLTEGKHCSRCDYTSGREVVDALGHNVVVDAAVPATCYSTGLTEGKHCDRCEEVLVAQTETTMIPHTYDEEGFDETCNAEGCTHVRTCAHDGEKTVVAGKAPTCTVAGLTDGETCAICGDVTKAQEVINALGHDMAEATCTAPATCKRGCGHTVGTSKGHSYDDGVVTTAPTCTEKGVKTYTCSACGDSYTEEVAAAGHSYTPVVTAPTCTEDGYITYTCSCGDSYTAPGQASTGHAWGEWVIDVEPTEETEGAKHRDCTNCDEVETAVIPELSHVHSYTTSVVAPTCTEKGYTKHTCRCGDTYNTDEVDAKGHSWNNGDVTTASTCTEKGVKTYTCANCGGTKTEDIDALGHNTEGTVAHKDATCTEEGVVGGTYCTRCNEGKEAAEVTIPATGVHAWDNGVVTTPAGCETTGVKTYTCGTCGGTKTEEVAVAGHSWDNGVVTTPAGCESTGVKTYTCQNDASHTYEEPVDATGHTEPNADGLCDNCDKPLTNEAILKALFALESGKSLAGKYTLTGVITKIDTAYSSQYKNITVTIVVDGLTEYPVQCYRMKGTGADAIKVGDTITVTGTLKNYNGTKEYDSGCTLDKYTEGHTCVGKYACSENCVYCGTAITPAEIHVYDEFGVCQCGAAKHTHVDADLDFNCDVEGCDETVIPKAGTKLTVAQAIALGKLYSDNQYTTGEYVISGTVTKIHEAWNTQYNNMSVYITDETGSILVYRLKAQVGVGDKITVTGKVGTYGVTQQIKEATGVIDEAHVCSDYTEATCEKLAECKVCGATTGELAEHNYVDGACTVCGTAQGVSVYTETITISSYASAHGWADATRYGTMAVGNYIVVTADPTTGSYNNTGKYYANGNNWRMYQNEAPEITFTANNGAVILSVKVTYSVYNTGVLTLNGENITSETVVEVNSASITFSVGNTGTATNGQVRISAIEVKYSVESHVCKENVENVAEVPATCDKAGTTAGTKCSKCGTVLSGCEEVKALGHDWNDWAVTKEAECGVAGEETRTCKNDSTHKETKAVAALVHNYVNGECEHCGEAENQGGTTPQSTSVKFDFTNSTTSSSTTALTQTKLQSLLESVYEGEVDFTVGSTIKYVYPGNSSSGPVQTNKLLKMGKSSGAGEFSLTFGDRKVTKVVINCQNWGSTKTNKIAVNGMTGVVAPQASAGDVTFELTSPSNTIKFTTTERIVIYSITIYFE